MPAVSSIILGGLAVASAGAGVMGGMAAKKEAEYQADVAEANARAESLAIGAEAERLADEQREIKSQQRVTAAASGGGLSSGQNIMILAEQAQKMQMDQLELQRQQDITLATGKSQAKLLKMQGKNAYTASLIGGVVQGGSLGVSAYQSSGAYQNKQDAAFAKKYGSTGGTK